MLTINLGSFSRQAFLAHACRYALDPISVLMHGGTLIIEGLSPEDAAAALACAVFPARELQLLRRLAKRAYRQMSAEQRERLVIIAHSLIVEDLPGEELYQGPYRGQQLTAAIAEELSSGYINFDGFCRFRLPGYQAYLRQALIRAEEELLAEEENIAYIELLQKSLSDGCGEVRLFFYPGDICQIWQRDGQGLRQLEGGHIRGVEWLLLANLINLDPEVVVLQDSMYADLGLLDMIHKVFGPKVMLAGEECPLEKILR